MDTILSYLNPLLPATEDNATAEAIPTATVEDVLKDFQEMETHGMAMRDKIRNFPETGGTLMEALGIHNDVFQLQTFVTKTEGNVKAVPLPIALEDGNRVMEAVNRLKVVLEEALKLIVEKKATFEQLSFGIPSIIHFDLTSLHDSVVPLEDALLAVSPPELLEAAQAAKTDIEAFFSEAIAAYS
ncbi:hypothetical protein NP233_g6263 [Leucocoprinus birnbaumii]|uniref:Uncharacterized protein n=1 Tax=Leucocoprinus birnbaumii TaxID=56174 RepID=A0AAD5YVP7_9AGAR|nr:hypothetical protein NP233_g6263 [Leucocoprinus birnbaumii]